MIKKILYASLLFLGFSSSVFAGFYVGPGLNYENLWATHLRYEGMRPMIMGGYGDLLWEWLYFAVEGFAGTKSIEISNRTFDGNSLKTSYTYGGSLIPGYFLEGEILLYGRLSLLSTKFDSLDVSKSGYEAGVGLEAPVFDCWSVRGEYDYVRYRSIADIGRIQANEFILSILYRF